MTFFIMLHNWLWHHIILMALPVAPIHSTAQDDQIEVQHDFSGYVMQLALTSYDQIHVSVNCFSV